MFMSWVLVNYVAMDLEIYISLQVNIFVFFGQIPRNGIAPSQVALVVKNPATNSGDLRDTGSIPGVEKLPWRRVGQPTPLFLPGESHGQKSLEGYSPWSRKKLDMTEATCHVPW